jgi:hypothetical protein
MDPDVADWRRDMTYEDVRHSAAGVTNVPAIHWINRPTFQQVVQIGGDMDGDGCTDAQERGPDETLGGRRDPQNPWDYFNPTLDGVNRIDDVNAVVEHYAHDQGVAPDYDARFDRTLLAGANPWQFDEPDGLIRIVDISAAVRSYGHDCGPY